MWKTFLLLACVTGSFGIVSGDNAATNPTEDTGATQETNPTGATNPTEETKPTEAEPIDENTDGTRTDEIKGYGGYPPICGKNEVYYNCSGECTPRRCSEIGYPLNCDKKCTPGCVCKDNYVRADNGTCIPIPDCPSCGGDKNAQQGCSNYCGNTCSTYNKPPPPCPLFCIVNGCSCRKGYVYDNNVKACVKPKDCTPVCQANEEYSPCINGGCDARNCSQIGKPVPCIKLDPNSCIKGCVCVEGYLRASNGTCVPKDQCTPLTHQCPGQNEFYDTCISGCSNQSCETIGEIFHCPLEPAECRTGCRCKPGFYRNASNVCVSESRCPTPPCPEDEYYSRCPTVKCEGDYCPKNRHSPQTCPVGIVCDQPRCVCGLLDLRDRKTGKCIKAYECPPFKCDGPNEEYDSCPAGCPGENCTDYINNSTCPPFKISKIVVPCRPQCRCKKGYYRNSDGICILASQCAYKCGHNEVFGNCTNGGCEARNCSQAGKPVPCVKLDPKSCIKGCVCQRGYLRSANGTCVPQYQCNEGCGNDPNAHPGCGVNCGRKCSTYKIKYVACILNCDLNGCDCNDGYVFDPNVNKCVLPKYCTPTCGLNEVYSNCTNGGCDHRNCSQLGQPQLCIDRTPESCTKGCVCASGYLRAANGTCIPQDKCPATGCGGDPNAQPGCGHNCGTICNTYKIKQPICPRLACKPDGCDCKDGYLFDGNINKCVLPQDCTLTCGLNEVYSSCTNGGCDHRNCSQLGQPQICIKRTPESCTKGCICASGYLRAANGTCVPQDECPATGCGGDPNAQPGCGYNCGKTCTTYKAKIPICPRIPCKPTGCDCKDGYVYDENVKKCVVPQGCSDCGINEVYDVCPTPCPPRRCDVDDRLIRCAAPPQPGDPACKPGCRCADGYARNATGTCVLRKQCEQPLTCDRPNEIYDSCPAPCPGESCDVDPALVLCAPSPQYGNPACKPACRCIDGYARNAANECVPRDQCNYKCGPNEVLSNCTNGGCEARNCSQAGKPVPCVKLDPESCIKGCVCQPGYLRSANGTCVPQNQCNEGCGNDPNAHPGCGVNCGRTCSTYKTKNVACILICYLNGCDCNDGFVFDPNVNKCVLPEDCTPTCKVNEEYSSCINGGCDPRNCSQVGQPKICIDPLTCIKGCVCVKGYLRASNGTCVPTDQCPQPTVTTAAPTTKPTEKPIPYCKVNEEYSSCINGGCDPRNCSQVGQPTICIDPITCIKGCVCVKGYLRASNGTCVPTNQCPAPDCPTGEVWSTCPTVKCDGDYCAKTRDSPQTCPVGIVCDKPRCVCGYNRKRDRKTGNCIPIPDCPPFKCDSNEEYQACPSSCPGEKCSDYINKTKCPPYRIGIIVNCKPACKCIEGYYRNDDGKCVPASKCPADSQVDKP